MTLQYLTNKPKFLDVNIRLDVKNVGDTAVVATKAALRLQLATLLIRPVVGLIKSLGALMEREVQVQILEILSPEAQAPLEIPTFILPNASIVATEAI